MLVTSALMLIMNSFSCSPPFPLPKMTGLFMSITFWQEEQENGSTGSPSLCSLPRLRNLKRSLSHTSVPTSQMSSPKKLMTSSPPHQSFNHTIKLKDSFVPKITKVYPLNPAEKEACKAFINKHLRTGCIVPSKSPQAAPFFFIPKKDGTLRPCQDYHYLNSHTIRNGYPLPLIPELIDDMKESTLFTRFNI